MYRQLSTRTFSSLPRGDLAPPFRRHRTPTSVLEALSRATGILAADWRVPRDEFIMARHAMESVRNETRLQKGREAAQYFFRRSPNLFAKFDFARPQTNALRPTHNPDNTTEPSEANLARLIAAFECRAALEMFDKLQEAGPVSDELNLRLLELAAATCCLPLNLRTSPQDFVSWRQNKGLFGPDSAPERLLAQLRPELRGARALQAMIRGAERYGYNKRVIQLYEELRQRQEKPDLATFNSVFRAVPRSRNPWLKVVNVFSDLLDAGHKPNTESFNAMIYGLVSHAPSEDVEKRLRGVKSIVKEQELRDVTPNVGTFTVLLHALDMCPNDAWLKNQIDKVLRVLLVSPCRHEFSCYNDIFLLPLIFNTMSHWPISFIRHTAQLLHHSPNLAVNPVDLFFFFVKAFEQIELKEPNEAVKFYEDNVLDINLLPPLFKCKSLRAFLHHKPSALKHVLIDIFRGLVTNVRGLDCLHLDVLRLACQMIRVRPICEQGVFEATQYLVDCSLEVTQLTSKEAGALLCICLPRDCKDPNMDARLDLGVWVLQHTLPTFLVTSKVLLLIQGLAQRGRFEEAVEVVRSLTQAKLFDVEPEVVNPLFKEVLQIAPFVKHLKEEDPELSAAVQDLQLKVNKTDVQFDSMKTVVVGRHSIEVVYKSTAEEATIRGGRGVEEKKRRQPVGKATRVKSKPEFAKDEFKRMSPSELDELFGYSEVVESPKKKMKGRRPRASEEDHK